jgi:hypothetical protein
MNPKWNLKLVFVAAFVMALAPMAAQTDVDPETVVDVIQANISTPRSAAIAPNQADRAMSGVLISRTGEGIDFRIADDSVSEIQVDVYSVSKGNVLWTSNRVAGNTVNWQAALEGSVSFRFSIKGWDQSNTLVTHQITTKVVNPISNISFDSIPADTKILGAGEIDLDGPTNVNGTLIADSFYTHEFRDSSVGNNTVTIEADNNSASDLLELVMVDGSATGQFIEFQEGTTAVGQINADGSAWFQNSTQQIPAFLPVAFGFIEADGTVASSSGNISSTWTGARYEISITGHTYFYNDYTTLVTLSNLAMGTTRASSGEGDLFVYVLNNAGIPSQASFQFVTYKNPNDPTPARPINDTGLDDQ